MNIPDWLKAGMMLSHELGFDPVAVVQASFYNKQMNLNRFGSNRGEVPKRLDNSE